MGISNIDSDLWRLGTMIFGAFLSFMGAWALYKIQAIKKKRADHEERIAKLEAECRQIDINTKRLNGIENENKEVTKLEIEKGGFMTTKDHAELCKTVCAEVTNLLTKGIEDRFRQLDEKLEQRDKNLALQFEVQRLSILSGNGKKKVKK